MNPTNFQSWQSLISRSKFHLSLKDEFASDDERAQNFSISAGDIFLDYSKNLINHDILSDLINLAKEVKLEEKRQSMFNGEKINFTENRAVLHVALRAPKGTFVAKLDGVDVSGEAQRVLSKMSVFAEKIRSGQFLGHTDKPIKNIVNIGIGGSSLGPEMAVKALASYRHNNLEFRFISNIDPADFAEKTQGLNPEETLFVIASKTFTTDETMTNAETAKSWIIENLGGQNVTAKHFVAISTNTQGVSDFGIDLNNMFEFWDWVGGRYSLTSAIGLPVMIAIGPEKFNEMLDGFNEIDEHFKSAPLEKNMPVILALISIWYRNFLGTSSEAVIPYSEDLARLPAYLQQACMESNGKSNHSDGSQVSIKTSPVIWGEPGTDAQHSFFQLLHQGTDLIPTDFIGFIEPIYNPKNHHDKLISNMIAQAEALAFGKTLDQVLAEGTDPQIAKHKVFAGNRPSNTLMIKKLSPGSLGQLIALYEHKIFVQGVIWNINSFDQMGVELGKQLAKNIYQNITEDQKVSGHDSSTNQLINIYKNHEN